MAFTNAFVFALVASVHVEAGPPQTMRAAMVTKRSWDFKFHLDKVKVLDSKVPTPGHGEVLVEVHTSNINPVDHKIVEMAGLFWSYPHKLGSDLAGVVVSVGTGCERLKVGDQVWGEATTLLEAVSTGGTYAQYATISESILGLKPKSLSMAEAGSLPMVSLTGYEALSWAAGGGHFKSDNVTVLVLGGTGGTGHVGIQMAKAMGAKEVITTCSGSHAEFVKSLGADRVIDYHKDNYYDVLAAKSVDVVYDCVGQSGTGDHAYPIIKENGHFVTLLMTALPSIAAKVKRWDVNTYAPTCVGGCSQYQRINAVSEMVEAGKLKVSIDVTYDLEDIVKAYNHSIAGHTTGKISLRIKPDSDTVVV